MTIAEIKESLKGEWGSLATELRPSVLKNADGSAKPFYLARDFTYENGDRFTLTIINSADPCGKVPLVKMRIEGHISWMGDHPIAAGAQKVDFTADVAYEVTPLLQGFADVANHLACKDYEKWEVNKTQSVFGNAFAPFGLKENENFKDFDLIYLHDNFLFWGARNVDGRGFDTEANRPTNLQIPLVRKK